MFRAFPATKDCSQSRNWLVDSGVSSHMTWDKELLMDYREFETPEMVSLGDGWTVNAFGAGNVHLKMFKVN